MKVYYEPKVPCGALVEWKADGQVCIHLPPSNDLDIVATSVESAERPAIEVTPIYQE